MKVKFKDLKVGDIFRSSGYGNIHVVVDFDIFEYDRVTRTRKPNAATCVIIGGDNSGKYDGIFRDEDTVDKLTGELNEFLDGLE